MGKKRVLQGGSAVIKTMWKKNKMREARIAPCHAACKPLMTRHPS